MVSLDCTLCVASLVYVSREGKMERLRVPIEKLEAGKVLESWF